MAGRFAYFLIGGAAVVGGMFVQGDISINDDEVDREVARVVSQVETKADVDRTVDQVVDRTIDEIVASEDENGDAVATDPAMKRALAEAVAELVRAEGSLITVKLDDNIPAAVIKQAEERRNAARAAVERLAQDAKAGARGDRDALRQNIRDQVREEVREAVRS